MTVFTGAGTVMSISENQPATYDEVGYSDDTNMSWTVLGEVTSIPEHGPSFQLITHLPLGERVTVKRKGSINYGSLTLPLALDQDDAGQQIARDYADGTKQDESAPIKIEWPNGAVRYFTAQIMSFVEGVQNSDSIAAGSINMEIDREVVYVAPTP